MKGYVFFGLLAITSVAVQAKNIEVTAEQASSAQSIINNILSKAQEQENQVIAERMAQQGKQAINDGLSHFTGETLDAFGVTQDDIEQVRNPHMVNEQLVLFVSASMPMQTLRAYARDMSKVGGVLAIRGALQAERSTGKAQNKNDIIADYLKTRQWIWSILRVNPNCTKPNCETWPVEFIIDPVIFGMYDIQQVPALIYQPDMKIGSYCDTDTPDKAEHVVYGDAYLGRMLNKLYEQTGNEHIHLLKGRL